MKRNIINFLSRSFWFNKPMPDSSIFKILRTTVVLCAVLNLLLATMVKTVSALSPEQNLKAIHFSDINNWSLLDKRQTFAALNRSCIQMSKDNRALSHAPIFGGDKDDWLNICKLPLLSVSNQKNATITNFFEQHFTPFRVVDDVLPNGLFTGYFEPEVEGSLVRTDTYKIPIYAKPPDLIRFNRQQQNQKGFGYGRQVNGNLVHYHTRKEIEQGALKGRNLELLWLKHRADAFFVQIQGSGRVRLPDGKSVRLGYAAKSGLPYTPIGKVLIESGELEKATISMQTIRGWLDKNPDQAQQMMWQNKSFVFFRLLNDVPHHLGPIGAQQVHLTPDTSLAVDRRYWALGTPVLLDIEVEIGSSEKLEQWQSLMIAQDTGSAIRGLARGDVFWGSGEKAALTAGKMKSQGTMIVLIPNTLAKKWTQKPQKSTAP